MTALKPKQMVIRIGLVAAVVAAGFALWLKLQPQELGNAFASANGRIEATEVDVATKLAGRIASIAVDEGDFLQPGQVVARMDTQVLEAQLQQARAQVR
ncbi:hypothetical protein A4X03_0g8340, partial [Tilletia caries]